MVYLYRVHSQTCIELKVNLCALYIIDKINLKHSSNARGSRPGDRTHAFLLCVWCYVLAEMHFVELIVPAFEFECRYVLCLFMYLFVEERVFEVDLAVVQVSRPISICYSLLLD